MAWTDEQDEIAAAMWRAGESARDIAGRIGKSRNAVIGRMRRLEVRQGDGGKPAEASAAAQKPLAKPAAKAAKKPRKSGKKAAAAQAERPPRKFFVEDAPESAGDAVASPHPVRIELHDDGQCRWPLGDPASDDFRYCGNPVAPDDSTYNYCSGHRALAFASVSRVAKAKGVAFVERRRGKNIPADRFARNMARGGA